MKKIIKLTESQLEKLTETRINEVSAVELASVLKDIPCTGEGIKSLINKKLKEYGFEDVIIKFLGYGEDKKILKYIVQNLAITRLIITRWLLKHFCYLLQRKLKNIYLISV